MIVCIPVTPDGRVGGGFGRAQAVAVADVTSGQIAGWDVVQVDWGVLHGSGSEGAHHARIARFLRERAVQAVVAGHMGPGMSRMLATMGIATTLGAVGDARAAVLAALAGDPPQG